MKRFLRKLFLWDAPPARGAFFGLTCLFVGTSLWFTLFQLLWLSGSRLVQQQSGAERSLYELEAWAIGQLLISLYSLTVFLRAGGRLGGLCHRNRNWLPMLGACGATLLWVAAALVCLLPFIWLARIIGSTQWMTPLPALPPHGWSVIYLVVVLCLFAGGFLTVKACSCAERKPLRAAVNKAGIALWIVFWTAYVVLLGLAMTQSHRMAQTRAQVEQRFGHPLTAEGLRDFYQSQGPVDADFWKHAREVQSKLSRDGLQIGDKKLEFWSGQLPDKLTPEVLAAFEGYCREHEEALLEVEKCFDDLPPLPSYDFKPGNLTSLVPLQLSQCRQFVQLEISRLRVFLARQNREEALHAYRRLVHCADGLRREPYLIGGLVWVAIEGRRLDAMEHLLASRLLTEDDLRLLAEDLDALAKTIPMVHRRAMYSEATFAQDVLWALKTGKLKEAPFAIGDFRFFFPQLWLQAARDNTYLIQQFLREDSTKFDTDIPTAYVFSKMLLPALKVSGEKFHRLSVRVLAMQTLLRAEAYRREHGDFPQALPEMPTDPYTGKSLRYQYGTATFSELALVEDEDAESSLLIEERKTTQGKAVQVWSASDDDATECGKDDPCARLRLEK